ncbi:tetratricopeptide repeat protein [Synechococcus sp. AH-603-M21]|nr:tetratricopeptide repeat protein [Synechococcus sp. AH-603-M21]
MSVKKRILIIEELYASGDYQKCLKACKKEIQKETEEVIFYKYAGKILLHLGQSEMSKEYLLRAQQLDSKDPEITKDLGNVWNATKNYNEAAKYYQLSIKINPNFTPAINNLGLIAKQEGNLKLAQQLLEKARRLAPESASYHLNLASIYQLKGDNNQALTSTLKHLELKPNNPEALLSLGCIYKDLGDLDKALIFTLKSIKLKSKNPDALLILGNIYKDLGNLEKALISLLKYIKLKPQHLNTLLNVGNIYQKLGDLDQAENITLELLKINPNIPEAIFNLGNILRAKGNLSSAINCYEKSVRINPQFSDALLNLGGTYNDLGDFDKALIFTLKSLEIKTDNYIGYLNLGSIYKNLGDFDKALASTLKSIELNDNNHAAYLNLGGIYTDQGELDQALVFILRSLEIKADIPEAYSNLGNIYMQKGNLKHAIDYYKKALNLRSNFPDAQWNLACAMFHNQDYKNGWEKFECRQKKKRPKLPHSKPNCSQFNHDNFKNNYPLILVSEQGLGDTLQFMRYAIALKEQGRSISICAQTKLHGLIQASGLDPSPLSPEQGNQISKGQWIPLLSVPRYLGVTPENPIINEPYIKTNKPLINKWKDILSGEQKPIIGINWQGNPNVERMGLHGRSLPLEAFSPITSQNQFALLSLQKGIGSEQLITCSFKERFVRCQSLVDETWNFLETAAIIANCDLIITSDTSVAHLAAGMGKNTWLLLTKVPDWRWGLQGDRTFWYPSMRLFRQKERGNWDEVIQRVEVALRIDFPSITYS